jgi:hypothetical protein
MIYKFIIMPCHLFSLKNVIFILSMYFTIHNITFNLRFRKYTMWKPSVTFFCFTLRISDSSEATHHALNVVQTLEFGMPDMLRSRFMRSCFIQIQTQHRVKIHLIEHLYHILHRRLFSGNYPSLENECFGFLR